MERRNWIDAGGVLNKSVAGSREWMASVKEEDQEAVWIRESKRGNTAAFNHLVLRWEKTVYNLALRMLQDEDEASEATQEVFLRAFKSIRRFRGRARFSTWLYRIAGNLCLTRLRRRPQAAHYSLDTDAQSPLVEKRLRQNQSQDNSLLQRERRDKVHQALQRLSDPQRLVVELKVFQDRSFQEVAAITGVPMSTAKSRFYASLEILRKSLGHLSAGI